MSTQREQLNKNPPPSRQYEKKREYNMRYRKKKAQERVLIEALEKFYNSVLKNKFESIENRLDTVEKKEPPPEPEPQQIEPEPKPPIRQDLLKLFGN